MNPESAGTAAQVSVGVLLAIVIEARSYFALFEAELLRRRQVKPTEIRATSLNALRTQATLLFYFTIVATAATAGALLLSLLVTIDDPTDGSGLGGLVKLGIFIGLGYAVITPVRVYGVLFVRRFEGDIAQAAGMISFATWGLTLFYFGMALVYFGFTPDASSLPIQQP